MSYQARWRWSDENMWHYMGVITPKELENYMMHAANVDPRGDGSVFTIFQTFKHGEWVNESL